MSAITLNTDREYFAYDAINASRLKLWLKSPNHFFDYASKPETEAMRIGGAFHAFILGQPVKILSDRISWNTKAGKEQKAEVQSIPEGTDYLFANEVPTYSAMQDAIMAHPAAASMLSAKDQVKETGIIWQHETGAMCKVKPDSFFISKKSERAVIIDLKTCKDASPRGFAKACYDYHYPISDALYRQGVKALTGRESSPMYFIMIEKEPPYYVGVYTVEDWQSEVVTRWISESLAAIQRSDYLGGSPYVNEDHKQGIFPTELPPWYLEKFISIL